MTEKIQVSAPEKINAFKEKVFTNYVEANIASALAESMGPHAALFMKHSMSDFLDKKEQILAGLTLGDDIEESVAKSVDEIVPAIIAKNTDSFKQLLFDMNVNDVVKKSFEDELGIYTEVFFKKIEPAYQAKKERILRALTLDENLGSAMLSQLSSITPKAVQAQNELKTACAERNTFVKELNQLIEAERASPNQSLHRKEKIELLTELQQRVSDTSLIPAEDTLEYLHQTYLSAQTVLTNHQINFDHSLNELGVKVRELEAHAKSNPKKYTNIAQQMRELHTTLTQKKDSFFAYPTAKGLAAFRQESLAAIDSVEKNAQEHRGWHTVHPILRAIVGILAAISVIPALVVAKESKHGFFQTFFAKPETDTQQKAAAFREKFNAITKEIEVEITKKQIKCSSSAPNKLK